jgi:hypothetical protein
VLKYVPVRLMPQTDEACGLLQREQWIRFQMVREGLAQTLPRTQTFGAPLPPPRRLRGALRVGP